VVIDILREERRNEVKGFTLKELKAAVSAQDENNIKKGATQVFLVTDPMEYTYRVARCLVGEMTGEENNDLSLLTSNTHSY
jgi:hypothetical protein